MKEPIPLASLSLTHVFYNPHDPISYLCAWIALIPQALCVIYVTLVWSTREVEIGLMFAGQLGCEAVNFALKRLIKQERPLQMNGKGYGMPSSHAQFLAFFSVSLTLFLLVRHKPVVEVSDALTNKSKATKYQDYSHLPLWQRVLVACISLMLVVAMAASRVYLSYHSVPQVVAGCIVGVVSAIGWFIITAYMRESGWIGWCLETRLAKLGRWRDLVVQEDLVQGGWVRWNEVQDLRRQSIMQLKHKNK